MPEKLGIAGKTTTVMCYRKSSSGMTDMSLNVGRHVDYCVGRPKIIRSVLNQFGVTHHVF